MSLSKLAFNVDGVQKEPVLVLQSSANNKSWRQPYRQSLKVQID